MGECPRRGRATGAPHGRFPSRRNRSRTPVSSRQREHSARLHHPIRQHQGAYRGPRPLPNPRSSGGTELLRGARCPAIPRSLTNIYKELTDDLRRTHAHERRSDALDESRRYAAQQMPDRRSGQARQPSGQGWEIVTDAAIKALNNRRNPDGSIKPLVAILWGRKAQMLGPLLTNAYIIASPHPSPMSARYGFFGSKPFSRANQALIAAGEKPVDWSLPSA